MKTAVEWLVEQLIPNAMRMFDATTCNAIEEAIKMEKEQIVKAHSNGWNKGIQNEFVRTQEYYNETFNK